MKKTVFTAVVLLLALVVVWVSCNGPKEPKSEPLSESDTSYLLLSQLAFKAYLFGDSTTIEETRALYLAAQKDLRDLDLLLDSTSSVSAKQISKSEASVASLVALAPPGDNVRQVAKRGSVDLCPCPDSSGLCACPGDYSTIYFATQSDSAEAYIGEEKLVAEPGLPAKGWISFKLPENVSANFTLTIRGDFTGLGRRTYEVKMAIRNGDLFMEQWKPLEE